MANGSGCTRLHSHTHFFSSPPLDLMLGESPSEVLKEVLQDGNEAGEDPFGAGLSLEREEMVGQMVNECRQQLYPYYDPDLVDGWALCEPAGMRSVVAMAITLGL